MCPPYSSQFHKVTRNAKSLSCIDLSTHASYSYSHSLNNDLFSPMSVCSQIHNEGSQMQRDSQTPKTVNLSASYAVIGGCIA